MTARHCLYIAALSKDALNSTCSFNEIKSQLTWFDDSFHTENDMYYHLQQAHSLFPGNYRLGFFLFEPETQASQQPELARRSQSLQPGPSRKRPYEPDETAPPDASNTIQGYSSIGQPSLPLSTDMYQEVGIDQQNSDLAFWEWFTSLPDVPLPDLEGNPHQDSNATVQSLPSTAKEPSFLQETDLYKAFGPKHTSASPVCASDIQAQSSIGRAGVQDNSNALQRPSSFKALNAPLDDDARLNADMGTLSEDWLHFDIPTLRALLRDYDF